MIDASGLLRLLAWLSPAFPTGGFAYSHGLEWAIEAGDVSDRSTLIEWLTDTLRHGAGRSDAIVLRHAWRCPDRSTALAEFARSLAPTRERRDESVNQGNAFARAITAWSANEMAPDTPYPVAVGATARAHHVDENAVTLAFLQAFTGNLISAAVRLIPLGQTDGLRALAALEPIILEIADGTREAWLGDVGGCVFRSDLAAMRHETQYTRLFRS